MNAFHVDSEVGSLRTVLLHRPDLELRRLTPSNRRDLLFEEVLWVKRARQEHDAFADALRDHGVEVLDVGQLLAETVKSDDARSWVLDRVVSADELGRDLADLVRDFLDSADPTTISSYLIGGITTQEAPAALARTLRSQVVGAHGFILPPLPNQMFTRDTSCWIYGHLSVNPMALSACRRESVHLEAIYRFHPRFTGVQDKIIYGGADGDLRSATIEGGDVLVIGEGAVLVGMGARTTPQGVEALARNLFACDGAQKVIAVALPSRRAFMHLDTVVTMVKPDAFLVYPGVIDSMRGMDDYPQLDT